MPVWPSANMLLEVSLQTSGMWRTWCMTAMQDQCPCWSGSTNNTFHELCWSGKLRSPRQLWCTWERSSVTRVGRGGSSLASVRLTSAWPIACATCSATCPLWMWALASWSWNIPGGTRRRSLGIAVEKASEQCASCGKPTRWSEMWTPGQSSLVFAAVV